MSLRLLLVLTPLLLLPTAAGAQTPTDVVEEAAAALQTESVYLSPEADAIPDSELTALEDAVEEAEPDTGEIYIAVLPAEAGDASQLLEPLGRAVGADGTYAVVAGRSLQVATTTDGRISGEAVAAVGDRAVAENRGGTVSAVLLDFVTGIEDVATGDAPADGGGGAGQAEGDGAGFGGLLIPGLLVAGGGYALYRARRRRRQQREQLEEVKREVLVDLAALDAETRELHLRMDLPGVPHEAKAEYVEALEAYSEASTAIDRAQRPSDLQPVSERIERGVFAAATARARLDGEALPEHRLPCFFDPRHGPSVRDVAWSPPGGAAREVPACAADALRIEEGEEPATRQVSVGGQQRPIYDAPGYYGGWVGGYYGMGGGLFQGLLLGSILSGGFGGGWGTAATAAPRAGAATAASEGSTAAASGAAASAAAAAATSDLSRPPRPRGSWLAIDEVVHPGDGERQEAAFRGVHQALLDDLVACHGDVGAPGPAHGLGDVCDGGGTFASDARQSAQEIPLRRCGSLPPRPVEPVIDLSACVGKAHRHVARVDRAPACVVPHVLADRLQEVRIAPCGLDSRREPLRGPVDPPLPCGDDERVLRRLLTEQADGPVVVEPLRVARGLGELRRQGRQPSSDEGQRQGALGLTEVVNSGVQGRELLGRGLLELVDENEDADLQVPCGLAERLEERCEVIREPARVGDTTDWVDIDAECDRGGGIHLHAEGLEDAQQPLQARLGVATGRRPHAPDQCLAQGHRQ